MRFMIEIFIVWIHLFHVPSQNFTNASYFDVISVSRRIIPHPNQGSHHKSNMAWYNVFIMCYVFKNWIWGLKPDSWLKYSFSYFGHAGPSTKTMSMSVISMWFQFQEESPQIKVGTYPTHDWIIYFWRQELCVPFLRQHCYATRYNKQSLFSNSWFRWLVQGTRYQYQLVWHCGSYDRYHYTVTAT